MADRRLIRWLFAGGKPQGISVLRRAIGRGWPPSLIVWPPELPAADVSELRGLAGDSGIPAYPSSSLEDRVAELADCDLLLTCRFGLLKPVVFDAPRLGAINVHCSLLPRYRGVHPVAWALVRGEKVTGVTVHRIDAKIDNGPILGRIEVPIAADDDIWSLTGKLDVASAAVVDEVLDIVHQTGHLPDARAQMGTPSRAPRRRPEDGRIDWSKPARGVHDLCRALRPPMPPPFTFTDGHERIHVLDSRLPCGGRSGAPGEPPVAPAGTVVAAGEGGWCAVACGGGGTVDLLTDKPVAPGIRLS